jgi:hypothetical protein
MASNKGFSDIIDKSISYNQHNSVEDTAYDTVNQSMIKGIKHTLAEFGLFENKDEQDSFKKERKELSGAQFN